jgi:hypothetical protein
MGLRTSGILDIFLYALFFFVVLSLLVIALKRGGMNIGTYEEDTLYKVFKRLFVPIKEYFQTTPVGYDTALGTITTAAHSWGYPYRYVNADPTNNNYSEVKTFENQNPVLAGYQVSSVHCTGFLNNTYGNYVFNTCRFTTAKCRPGFYSPGGNVSFNRTIGEMVEIVSIQAGKTITWNTGEEFNPTNAKCTPCPAGYRCPTTNTQPIPCTAGTFSPAGQLTCTPVASGYYSGPGAGSQIQCPAGYRCPTSNTQPIQCTIGTFSPAGQLTCETCPAGTYSSAGAAACTPVASGYYSGSGAGTQIQCPAGYRCPTTNTQPIQCTAGTFSPAGQLTCQTCSAGTYAPAGAAACTTTGSGYYSGSGAGSQELCPAGHSCAGGIIQVCPPWTFSPAGQLSCTPCPAGTYCGTGTAVPSQCNF